MTSESTLEEILDRWEDARERGEQIGVEQLCRDHPDLAAEVEARMAAIQQVEARMQEEDSPANEDEQLTIESRISPLEFHAKGGLGSVFVGEDRAVHRKVAVKFIHAKLANDPASRQRFVLEAEITGRLEHPGVIPLYGVGEDSHGRLFYAMRFIDGITLDEAIRAISSRSSRSKIITVSNIDVCCRVLSRSARRSPTGHNRGIVHRDIKPENILLGRYGETIVVDWGLASSVLRDDRFRVSGEQTLMLRSGSSGIRPVWRGTRRPT